MLHPLDQALQECIHGRPDLSESILRQQDQDDLRVRFNLGWHDMRHGKLSKGFDGMNAGRFINVFGSKPIPGPIWRDQPLEGKTVLLRSEGGLGDEIINFRFAEDFKRKGAQVVVACSKSLAPLFASQGYACVTTEAAEFAYYDYWVPAMSAAYVLQYEYKDLSGKPYIKVNGKSDLIVKDKKLKVGIRWSGNPQFEHEQHRRFDPQKLIDLHSIDGASFYSLQRDDNLVNGLPFVDLRDKMSTFADTAAIINSLDLVITSCTSVAHLSAAMGKETWVVVPVLPYYIWARPGNKSAWYDSVTLFRQEKYGNWDAPFEQIKMALKNKVERFKGV